DSSSAPASRSRRARGRPVTASASATTRQAGWSTHARPAPGVAAPWPGKIAAYDTGAGPPAGPSGWAGRRDQTRQAPDGYTNPWKRSRDASRIDRPVTDGGAEGAASCTGGGEGDEGASREHSVAPAPGGPASR